MSATTLGPFALAPFERPTASELHFENESRAWARPEPTATLKLRVGLFDVSDPEKVRVWVKGGGGAGAVTTPVVAETAVPEPALFEAVTAARSVEPASAVCTRYVELVAPGSAVHPPPELSHRCH